MFALTLFSSLLFPGSGIRGQESRKLVKKGDLIYPDLARKMNMTGTVKVEISILGGTAQ